MKFHLKMDLSNDAFQLPLASPWQVDAEAVARELQIIAGQIAERHDVLTLYQGRRIADVNGNTVGRWIVEE